jgi:hypothetical protein
MRCTFELFNYLYYFLKVVQIIELKRFGGAPNGYSFAPLFPPSDGNKIFYHVIQRHCNYMCNVIIIFMIS